MKTYSYELLDGTKGEVEADYYVSDGSDYVFYKKLDERLNDYRIALRIPKSWLCGKIKEV